MNKTILQSHINSFLNSAKNEPVQQQKDIKERKEHITFYQGYDASKLKDLDSDGIYIYLSKLWAMRIWGNKHYKIDQVIEDERDEASQKLKEFLIELGYE